MIQRITNAIEQASPSTKSRLHIVTHDGETREVTLPMAGVVIGADSACDVTLSDPAVSRRHLTVVPTDKGFEVTDLESRNGTWVDGARLSRATLPIGATVRIGTTILQLLPADEPVAIPPSEAVRFGELRGASEPMRRVFAILERASQSDAPILLLGESGTGKELAARAVHMASPRAEAPFVVFDCGAASESLVEAELFGHKRGAFTGAHSDRVGAFAQAHGGTLFLDEIGDLPLALQPKLLRLLERGEVTPLGAKRSERYDVRIVAATHRDLWGAVGAGTFRGDLYYRLGVVEVHLPALRQRADDIPELVQHFLGLAGRDANGIDGPSLSRLLSYSWPGNVRELRNVLARAVALSTPETPFSELPIYLRPDTTPVGPSYRADVPYHEAKEALLSRFEREYFTDLLQRSGGNLSQAARTAGLERKYLYRVLERAGVSPRDKSPGDDA